MGANCTRRAQAGLRLADAFFDGRAERQRYDDHQNRHLHGCVINYSCIASRDWLGGLNSQPWCCQVVVVGDGCSFNTCIEHSTTSDCSMSRAKTFEMMEEAGRMSSALLIGFEKTAYP